MILLTKYQIILFVTGVTSMTVCTLTICIGGLEIYAEIKSYLQHSNFSAYVSHHAIALVIFSVANSVIVANILYFFAYALRGSRYIWYVSCNYLLYILSEMVSVIVVFTRYSMLRYPVVMAVLVAVQSVLLFLVTCAAQAVFTQVELDILEKEDIKVHRRNLARYRRLKSGRNWSQCYTISLYANTVDADAGTSRGLLSQGSLFSTTSSVMSVSSSENIPLFHKQSQK